MEKVKSNLDRIKELEALLEVSERKSDVLTNLLKEASGEFERTLEQIKISESNFRAIFENAPEAIYIIDTDTHQILDCNSFTIGWLGYSRKELLSKKVEDILEPQTGGIFENIKKAINDGLVHIQERRFVKKNGRKVDAEVTGTLVRFQRKQCFVALVRDVTQRKQIEGLSRYKELFKSVSDPVFINDQKGRFLEVNDVACECFGYPRDKLPYLIVLMHTKSNSQSHPQGHIFRRGAVVDRFRRSHRLRPFAFSCVWPLSGPRATAMTYPPQRTASSIFSNVRTR